MKGPVSVDEFLVLEEEARRISRLRAPAREVRRFHAAVRRFANAWCSRPARRIAALNSKQGVVLDFEVEDRYGWYPVFSLRAAHVKNEFSLKGPNKPAGRQKASLKLKKALETINKSWRALPGAETSGDVGVVVHLPRLADSGFDRFLEAAIEGCVEV